MKTVSMCPVCFCEIAAETCLKDGKVIMHKTCPVHGDFSGIVEVDPAFYLESLRGYRPIYPGHLVDVTDQCNLKCKYCYHENNALNIPTFAEIIRECSVNNGPYILSGGEPTLRNDLFDLLEEINRLPDSGQTTRSSYVLTNGHATKDRLYLLNLHRLAGIGLSFHEEGQDDFAATIEHCISQRIKLESVFFVIDDLAQVEGVVKWAREHPTIANTIRVKCASDVWSTTGTNKIYASQVLKEFMKHGETLISEAYKSSYVPILFEGINMAIISWYDVTNVDLLDIAMPPTYTAKNGETCDFLKAMLINQGIKSGWMKGRKNQHK